MGQHAETEVYRAGEAVARGNLEQGKDRFTTFRGKKVRIGSGEGIWVWLFCDDLSARSTRQDPTS